MKSEDQYIQTSQWDGSIFFVAKHAISNVFQHRHFSRFDEFGSPIPSYAQRLGDEYDEYHATRSAWRELIFKYKLHPVVEAVVRIYRPHDWQQLLFEWPHVSESDPTRLAYTRDTNGLKNDRQVVTSIGKYLRRHWPDMPDHMIRDYTASHTADEIYLVNTIEEMITVVELGPRSCMQSAYGSIPFKSTDHDRLRQWLNDSSCTPPRWDHHPYFVYQPKYGWRMCAHKNSEGKIVGRALVNISSQTFVRTYFISEGGYSGTDHVMEEWLKAQGFEHNSGWANNERVAWIPHPHEDNFMMPYLDGQYQTVNEEDETYLVIARNGEYTCTNTDGTHSGTSCVGDCEDCGETVRANDEYIYAGRHEDRLVCQSCAGDYHEVRGGRDYFYWVHEDDIDRVVDYHGYTRARINIHDIPNNVAYVDHNDCYAYDEDVVQIGYGSESGEYRYREDENIVCIDGDYYVKDDDCWEDANGVWHSDDDDSFTYEGKMYACDDGWQCDGTQMWYPDEVDYVEDENGNRYHPSYSLRVNTDAEDDEAVILRTEVNVYLDKEPYECLTSAEEAATV